MVDVTVGINLTDLVSVIITQNILFLVGLFYLKWHLNLKKGKNPFKTALIINIAWSAMGITMRLVITSLMGGLLITTANQFIALLILVDISDIFLFFSNSLEDNKKLKNAVK